MPDHFCQSTSSAGAFATSPYIRHSSAIEFSPANQSAFSVDRSHFLSNQLLSMLFSAVFKKRSFIYKRKKKSRTFFCCQFLWDVNATFMTQSLGSASVPLGKKPQLHYTKFSREHKIENLLTSPWTEDSEREVGRSTVLLSLNDKGWRLKNVEMLDISFNIDRPTWLRLLRGGFGVTHCSRKIRSLLFFQSLISLIFPKQKKSALQDATGRR